MALESDTPVGEMKFVVRRTLFSRDLKAGVLVDTVIEFQFVFEGRY